MYRTSKRKIGTILSFTLSNNYRNNRNTTIRKIRRYCCFSMTILIISFTTRISPRTDRLSRNFINFNTKITRRTFTTFISINSFCRLFNRLYLLFIMRRIKTIIRLYRLILCNFSSFKINITSVLSNSTYYRISMLRTIYIPSTYTLTTCSYNEKKMYIRRVLQMRL